MARRWTDPSAFRPDPGATPALRPTRRQSVALLAALALVAGTVASVSYLIRPERARAFDLIHGSLLIGDQFGPVSVDLGSGRGTLQLRGADQQAGVTAPGDLSLVPFDGNTLLLNTRSGEFNMVDTTGFLMKRDGGVTIGGSAGDTTATGVAAGQLAYILRTGQSGTDVLLVGPSTVATAAAKSTSVKPRASYSTNASGVTAEGGAVSANGALWALFRSAGTTSLRRLTLPPNSSTGVALTVSDQGRVPQLSALSTATTGADGTGPAAVGVLSPGTLRVVRADGTSTTTNFRAPAGMDTVVPTTNARDRIAFLIHGRDGWSLVSVAADGSGLRGPTALRGIDPDARLAPPAMSNNQLYTLRRDGTTSEIYRISLSGQVSTVADYPQKTENGRSVEDASFADGYVIASQSRVIVDSPGHYLAMTLFTDGSSKPVIIEKTNLTSLNADTSADSLTQGPVSTNPSTAPANPTNQQVSAPEINNKIDCKQVNQKPHVPTIDTVQPSARSVALSWVYPILSVQDCLPSTYVVSLQLISNNAPPAPGAVTLQGQTGTIIAGLFPDTIYAITVTAYINGQATPSAPVRVTTGKEGPKAPTDIQVTTDASGNWDLSWDGCGSLASSCVQVQSWTVTPFFCDGSGLSASPAPMSAPADSSSVQQPPTVYQGGDSILGRKLQFRIQGIGVDGTPGDVSALSSCVQSWRPPNLAGVQLSASLTSATATTASVNLNLGSDPNAAAGGIGATVTFTVSAAGGGGSQSTTVPYTGNTNLLAASFGNLSPGYTYSATAAVSPPGHPEAAATTGSQQLTTRAPWPNLGVNATCAPSDLLDCTLSVSMSGLASSDAHGERFSFAPGSGLYCGGGSSELPFKPGSFDPASTPVYTTQVSLLLYSGTCKVSVSLVEADGTPTPQYFGGTTSPTTSTSVNLGQSPTLDADASDFSVAWQPGSAQVKYTGSDSDSDVNQLVSNWNLTLTDPDGTTCGTSNDQPTHSGTPVQFTQQCLYADGDQAGWKVTIQYQDSAGGRSHSVGPITITGTPPGYVPPCSLSAGQFAASWYSDPKSPTTPEATVTFAGAKGSLQGCSGLTYQFAYSVPLSSATTCGPPTSGTATAPAASVTLTLDSACRNSLSNPLATWYVIVSWNDQRNGPQSDPEQITGTKPS